MRADLKDLIFQIGMMTLKTAMPLSAAVMIWDIPVGMSLIFGSFTALAGFAAGTYGTARAALGQDSVLLPVLINILKFAAVALSLILLARIRPALSVSFVIGHSLILLGITQYTKALK